MNSPATIQQIAEERLEEARILADSQKYDGAFYLLGYSVELELKAKICALLDIPNLFAEDQPEKIDERGFQKIRGVFKTHNLMHLLYLSGLKNTFDKAKAEDRKLFIANSLLFEVWNEQYRYKACGFCEPKDVKKLLELVNDVLEWIRRN